MQAFVHDDEVARFFIESRIVECEPTADVDQRVLLPAHCAAIAVRTELFEDIGDAAFPVAGFALLDKICILDSARRVQKNANAMTARQLPHFTHIRHRHGLATGHVDGGGHADIGDEIGADSLNRIFKNMEIDVALERNLSDGIVRLRHYDVDKSSTGQLLMQSRGREIHVAGHEVPRFDQHP